MSSTITVSRRVGAFRTATQVLYALYESTYENNVYPHTPHESCCAFGTLQSVMTWVLGAMSATCGGMLRRPGGSLTPMGYLQSWLGALAEPYAMKDRAIRLKVSTSWRASVPLDRETYREDNPGLSVAASRLREGGYHAQAAQLEAGEEVELSLFADGDVLATIYGDIGRGGRIAPWRILDPTWMLSRDAGLAPEPPNRRLIQDVKIGAIYDLGAEALDEYCGLPRLVLLDPLRASFSGIASSIMGDYLSMVAMDLERAHPGAGVVAAQALALELRKQHPRAPDTMIVVLDMRRACEHGSHYREAFETIRSSLTSPQMPEERVLRMSLGDLRASGQLPRVLGMSHYGLQFLPAADRDMGSTLGEGSQVDLFATAA